MPKNLTTKHRSATASIGASTMKIPRKLFQTAPRTDDLTLEIINNIDYLTRINGSWEYRIYNDRECIDFIRNAYGAEMLKLYLSINPAYGAARADLFRYLLIYHYGGVYLDLKSTCTKPLDKIITPDDEFLISHGPKQWGLHPEYGVPREFVQWAIICTSRHPMLFSVINRVKSNLEEYNPFRDEVGKIGVLRATGPIAFSLAITPHIESGRCRITEFELKV